MNCAPGPINFTMFLTMFGQKLQGTDPEDVIRNAFACFDVSGSGKKAIVSGSGKKAMSITMYGSTKLASNVSLFLFIVYFFFFFYIF